MANTINVEPQVLQAKSATFQSMATQVKALHDGMITRVNSLSGTWEGTAGEAYRAKFQALQASMDKIYTTIVEHSTDLNDIATEYIDADTRAEAEVDSLPASNL